MLLTDLDARSRDIFRRIVESYLDSGIPVGSRTLSKAPGFSLSPASIRNVMSDLETAGLLESPHTSAGRRPTQAGLRLFVDGIMEVGDLGPEERARIEAHTAASGGLDTALARASAALSGLSHCAGLVLAPKQSSVLKHIEFVALNPTRALVVLVTEDGNVENRVIDLPPDIPAWSLTQASNYLASRLVGRTLESVTGDIEAELGSMQGELDGLTRKVIADGLAVWGGAPAGEPQLIVCGHANLLENLEGQDDLERIRQLFDDLEAKKEVMRLLDLASAGEGVRIFIGAETNLFSLSGSSLIISPYMNAERRVVGAIGVIGPTRLNYARIIPMVDYTAHMITRVLSR